MNRSELGSIGREHIYVFVSYHETTYCVLPNAFFSDRNIADLAIIKVLNDILCVFSSFASLSWHFAYRAGGEIRLATAIIFLKAPQPEYAMVLYVTKQ